MNELDISARLSSILDVTWVSQVRLSAELVNPALYYTGLDFNFRAAKHLIISPYYHRGAHRTAAGSLVHRQSPGLAMTVFKSWGNWTLSDRNRFDIRLFANGSLDYWAYRNRPKVEKSFGPERWRTSLYLWDEVYYFAGPVARPRNRVGPGIRKVFSHAFAAELYYQHQNDSYSRPGNINTLGVLLDARIR